MENILALLDGYIKKDKVELLESLKAEIIHKGFHDENIEKIIDERIAELKAD